MELYYNPEQMSETEIKQTFVGRQWLLDELLGVVKRQPKGAGVQHVLLIGARGMGKTTLLLMLRFAVLEGELGKKWQPVRFPEESYGINDLADFWLAALANLANEIRNDGLLSKIDQLKAEYRDASDLAGAALAVLKDWSRKAKRRLLLLVDNLDMILDQIGNSEDNAALRNVLMNDGTIMLAGAATSFFKEARSYDQPLYNFFRVWNLEALDSTVVDVLLTQRASVDKLPDFEQRLRENRTRINVLHYFTGGNPRLILMLYRIIASSDFTDVRRSLEKLLDEVTPYYKAKIETLPPQQRKILDCIARVSGQTGEALTPTQVAGETRLPVNQISAQLKRLSNLGFVRAADGQKRNAYYSLSEPLYAIWHQMRFGRSGRRRMEWLVEFLKRWYSIRELLIESERLAGDFEEIFAAGELDRVRNSVESRRRLSDAIDPLFRREALDRLIHDCLLSNNYEEVRDLLRQHDPAILSEGTRLRLLEAGLLTSGEYEQAVQKSAATQANASRGLELLAEGNFIGGWAVLRNLAGGLGNFPGLLLVRAMTLMRC
jgi:DNA-binding MarR family transcriptional regulator